MKTHIHNNGCSWCVIYISKTLKKKNTYPHYKNFTSTMHHETKGTNLQEVLSSGFHEVLHHQILQHFMSRAPLLTLIVYLLFPAPSHIWLDCSETVIRNLWQCDNISQHKILYHLTAKIIILCYCLLFWQYFRVRWANSMPETKFISPPSSTLIIAEWIISNYSDNTLEVTEEWKTFPKKKSRDNDISCTLTNISTKNSQINEIMKEFIVEKDISCSK